MCKLVSLQLHSFVAEFTRIFIFTSVLMTVHTSSLPVLLVHGEAVGFIRTHHALPVYRPFHCLVLGNALFSALPLYQRIVNLMATVEGIGCHQALYIKKKKKKKKKKKQQGFFYLVP